MRLLHFLFKNQNRPLKSTRAKRNACRGSSMSRAYPAKLSVAAAELAPMQKTH